MSDPKPVLIPLLNPNEPQALLAGLHVAEGQKVSAGDQLCTLETTKSTADLIAEMDGFVVGLAYAAGQTANAGDLFCYLAASADWTPPAPQPAPAHSASHPDLPAGLRITDPALALAQQHTLDLSALPLGPLLTESAVRALLSTEAAPPSEVDPTAILVYGGSGHGKSLIDLLRALDSYRIVGIIDDGLTPGESVMDLPVLGGAGQLPALYAQGVRLAVNAIGGIGNIMSRVAVFERLAAAGFTCPALVHPTAFVEASAELTPGVQVFPHAYVGSAAAVGFGVIVNTGAIVSHDCVLGDYANIAPGSMLAGGVQVGEATLIGMGVTVNLNVSIGARARIGNSAVVKADVPANAVVRAGTSWPE